jgi:hypothetical protein
MWTTCVCLKSNKTAKQSGSSKVILLFTSPLFYYPSICNCQTLSARTVAPLNLLTIQSHPHTLEIQDFCLVIEMFMDFRKFSFLQYPFYLNNFYSFNFNLFCLDNSNLIRIKFLSLAVDHLSHLCGPQVEKRWVTLTTRHPLLATLAPTSPTRGGCLIVIVCLRTKFTDFWFFFFLSF